MLSDMLIIGIRSRCWNCSTLRGCRSRWGKILAFTDIYSILMLGKVDVPVKLQTDEQDVTINPGDYIIGDLNGVVCLPQELAEKTVALLPLQAEADHLVAQDIQAGIKFTDASKKRRAALRKP
jgi:hypothetical protein